MGFLAGLQVAYGRLLAGRLIQLPGISFLDIGVPVPERYQTISNSCRENHPKQLNEELDEDIKRLGGITRSAVQSPGIHHSSSSLTLTHSSLLTRLT